MKRILDTPHRYHIDHTHRTIYIWCSGTYSWTRGLRNFDLRRRRAYGRRINARDLAEARAIWGALTVTEPKAIEYEVVAMGYSLGGALAGVIALIAEANRQQATVVPFAPKRGMSTHKGLRIRPAVTYRGDPIPYVPPAPWYAPWPIDWRGRISWPWRAHALAARDAARARHEIGTYGGE